MTVLVADDHIIFREGLAVLLKKMPHVSQVVQASNGKQALEIIKQQTPDVVLMDIEMPVLNGIEATKAIKLDTAVATKVIALTMFNREADVTNLYDIGVDGYLLKDSSVSEVSKALEFVSEGKEYYCEAVKEVLFKALLRRRKNEMSADDASLTNREKEVLQLICKQYSTEEIANQLFLSPLTVNNHRRNILSKTKSKNVAGMVLYALQHGIYHLP